MDDLGVIDRFMQAFIRYIDSGFGLLGGDVHFLTATLIGIDITLAGLSWALAPDTDVIGRFLKKILFVGAFAFILNGFSTLADIVFRSFAQAGLTAGGGTLTADDLLRPGRVAATGFTAAWPLLGQAADMMGFASFFDNFLTIAVLLFAWAIVVLAFFILAVQMFVCVIEFKLTSLAGFPARAVRLVEPHQLPRRARARQRGLLGHQGDGAGGHRRHRLEFLRRVHRIDAGPRARSRRGDEPGAGCAVAVRARHLRSRHRLGPDRRCAATRGGRGARHHDRRGGVTMLAGGAAAGAARTLGGAALGAVRAGTAMGSAASTAYGLGQAGPGSASIGSGLGGMARAAGTAARSRLSGALGLSEAARRGRQAAWNALNQIDPAPASSGDAAVPAWARAMRSEHAARHHREMAVHALGQGDRGGASATPDLHERDR